MCSRSLHIQYSFRMWPEDIKSVETHRNVAHKIAHCCHGRIEKLYRIKKTYVFTNRSGYDNFHWPFLEPDNCALNNNYYARMWFVGAFLFMYMAIFKRAHLENICIGLPVTHIANTIDHRSYILQRANNSCLSIWLSDFPFNKTFKIRHFSCAIPSKVNTKALFAGINNIVEYVSYFAHRIDLFCSSHRTYKKHEQINIRDLFVDIYDATFTVLSIYHFLPLKWYWPRFIAIFCRF